MRRRRVLINRFSKIRESNLIVEGFRKRVPRGGREKKNRKDEIAQREREGLADLGRGTIFPLLGML